MEQDIDAKVDEVRAMFEGRTATVAIEFTVRGDALDLDTGELADIDNPVVRLDVDPQSVYPYPQLVTLAWYAANRRAYYPDEFRSLRDDLQRDDAGNNIQTIIERHPDVFGMNVERALKLAFGGVRRVMGEPPYSVCPRCGDAVWAHATRGLPDSRTAAILLADPKPRYCLRCGQRYAYDKDDNLRSEAVTNVEFMARRLAGMQPTGGEPSCRASA